VLLGGGEGGWTRNREEGSGIAHLLQGDDPRRSRSMHDQAQHRRPDKGQDGEDELWSSHRRATILFEAFVYDIQKVRRSEFNGSLKPFFRSTHPAS
jgi:hypothetical protein